MLQAEEALDSWKRWSSELDQKPVVLRPLSGGRSNRSILLDSDVGKLVLRLNAQNTLVPSASRKHETQIWQAASHAGIAPPLLYNDDEAGYIVSKYIENHLPANAQLNQVIARQALDLLNRCHQLQPAAPTLDYADHIERYWHQIEYKNISVSPLLREQRVPMQLALDTLHSSGTAIGLCHHDPVVANFVGSAENLYLIDWEYAANGLQILDYAAIGIEWALSDETIVEQTGIDARQLSLGKSLYGYICDLWEAQMDPGTSPG